MACASGGEAFGEDAGGGVVLQATNNSGEPVLLRYTFGTAVPVTLGNLRDGAQETYKLRFTNAGDLRVIADFVERRTGTSNPIVDLRPNDRLELVIDGRKQLRLTRADQG